VLSGLENPWHWAILLLVVLFVFGPKRLPELGRSLGRGIREFRSSVSISDESPDERAVEPPPTSPGS